MNKKFVLTAALLPGIAIGPFVATPLGAQNQTAQQPAAKPALQLAQSMAGQPITRGPWSGGVTATSAVVKAKIAPGASARLIVSGSGNHKFSSAVIAPETGLVAFPVDGLAPNTSYSYALEVNGKLARTRGRFRTFPVGPSSFDFAFASCARTASEHPVFGTIRKNNPLFFLHMGDLHYEDINETDRNQFRAAYDTVLSSKSQSELYRNVPLIYMWDDHDYAGNDSDARSKGREAARLTYQEYVPHYPLEGSGNVPLYQAFTAGRARFLISDLRSERSPADEKDGPGKTMLGARQKEWLKTELLAARGKYPLIFWMSSVSWNGKKVKDATTAGVDNWAAYDTERREIVDFITKNGISGVCILSGDAHMLAADSGENVLAYTGLRAPALQAAALDQYSSLKAGPKFDRGFYGPRPGEGCFGFINVRDNGQNIRVHYSGRNQDNKEIVWLDFEVPGTMPGTTQNTAASAVKP